MTSAKFNFGIAIAAVFSQTWLDPLRELSQIAAALMPFFGLVLIILQIIRLIGNGK